MKRGKKYRKAKEDLDTTKEYSLDEGVKLVKDNAFAKFDESVELSVRLGVDPKYSDQIVRGSVVLPHGTGKKIKVLVLTKGEKEKEAKDAGADLVGSDEYVEKINSGWVEVDAIVATPDMMGTIGRLGKILGPRGLMPNPKSGTVTLDVAKAVKELKAGRVEFRVDKAGNIGIAIGKVSFPQESLYENAKVFLEAIIKAKPSSAKGQYLKNVTLSSTMGVGVKLNTQSIIGIFK